MKKNKLFLTAGLAAVLAIGIFIYALNNSKYEVKFNSNGGSKVESVMVKKNERVEAPKDPKKEGYVFVEWQLNGKSYDFKKKVTSNITLNAKWLPEIYVTVTLDRCLFFASCLKMMDSSLNALDSNLCKLIPIILESPS